MIYTQLSRILCNDWKISRGPFINNITHPSTKGVTLLNKRGNGVWKLSIKCWSVIYELPPKSFWREKKRRPACTLWILVNFFGIFFLYQYVLRTTVEHCKKRDLPLLLLVFRCYCFLVTTYYYYSRPEVSFDDWLR